MASWKPVGSLKKLLVSTEKKEKIDTNFSRIYVQSVSVAEEVGTTAEMRRLSSRQ